MELFRGQTTTRCVLLMLNVTASQRLVLISEHSLACHYKDVMREGWRECVASVWARSPLAAGAYGAQMFPATP